MLCACLCVKWLGQRTTLFHPLPLWSSLLSEPRAHYPVRLAARDPSSLLSPLSHSAEVRGVKGATPILLTWERSKHSYSATYISSLSSLLMLRHHFMSTLASNSLCRLRSAWTWNPYTLAAWIPGLYPNHTAQQNLCEKELQLWLHAVLLSWQYL